MVQHVFSCNLCPFAVQHNLILHTDFRVITLLDLLGQQLLASTRWQARPLGWWHALAEMTESRQLQLVDICIALGSPQRSCFTMQVRGTLRTLQHFHMTSLSHDSFMVKPSTSKAGLLISALYKHVGSACDLF